MTITNVPAGLKTLWLSVPLFVGLTVAAPLAQAQDQPRQTTPPAPETTAPAPADTSTPTTHHRHHRHHHHHHRSHRDTPVSAPRNDSGTGTRS